MPCSTGCPNPGSHQTWGQCVRAKDLEIENPEARKFNTGIYAQQDAYREARNAGLQPKTVWKKDVDQAWRITEKTGTPYRADQ